jgi:hypothetical protein
MNAGDTLLIDAPGTTLDSHLWIVISDPALDPQRVVLVNMTSHRADKDQACVLEMGDHPYVSHRTCIEYRRAKVVRDGDMEALLSAGKISKSAPCSPALLKRIRDGVAASWMRLEVVAILQEQKLVDF